MPTRPDPYQLQSAIAACHATAPTAADTDWSQIAALYGALLRFVPTPVVRLNRTVAVAMADGPVAGLELVGELEASGELAGYYLLPAARADLLQRLGRSEEAAVGYRAALALVLTDVERRYLAGRRAAVGTQSAATRPQYQQEPTIDHHHLAARIDVRYTLRKRSNRRTRGTPEAIGMPVSRSLLPGLIALRRVMPGASAWIRRPLRYPLASPVVG